MKDKKDHPAMYTAFASVYDLLMEDVDYDAWAGFYAQLLQLGGVAQGKVCECACGTGGLTLPLSAMGYQMTGVDISPDMLFEASQKARKSGAMIPFVKQDMRTLRLHRQMDAVLCTNDGLNYLSSEADISSFFASAFQALRPGGVLAFDLSTPYKLAHVLGDAFWGDETESISYLWQNSYNSQKAYVDLDLAIFVKDADGRYRRVEEHQRQYAHSRQKLESLLAQAGFTDVRLLGDGHLGEVGPEECRWHVVAVKPLPQQPAPAAPMEPGP